MARDHLAARPLHRHRIQTGACTASGCNADRISWTAPNAGENSDPLGVLRQRLLVRLGEQPFGFQLPHHLLEGQLQGPHPRRNHLIHDQLVPALGHVEIDGAGDQDRQAVGGLELDLREGAAPHRARQHRFLVLEGEIAVAALMLLPVRDLALDRQPGRQILLQHVLDQRVDLRHGVDFRSCRCRYLHESHPSGILVV
jgi:hypothetical protein